MRPFHLVVWLLLAVTPAFAGQRALIVAINEYLGAENRAQLKGCVNDAETFAGLLKAKFGFADADIVLLTDAAATGAAIREKFRSHLIAGTKPDDVAVFFYAGHGSFVIDRDGDESANGAVDDFDEVLCPVDISGTEPKSWLLDDELSLLLREIPARRILTVLDCCHSAGLTRSASEGAEAAAEGIRFLPLNWLRDKPDSGKTRGANDATFSGISSDLHKARPLAVLLAASSSAQSAGETRDAKSQKLRGIFSLKLCELLEDKAVSLGFRELANTLKPAVQQTNAQRYGEGSYQTPAFESLPESMSVGSFLDGRSPAPGLSASPAPRIEPAPIGTLKVSLSTDQPAYKLNDLLQFRLTVERDAYVRIYHRSVDGKVFQIFPNRHDEQNFVKAGSAVTIPPPADGKFRLRITPPAGNEVLMAVASTEKFSDADVPAASLSRGLPYPDFTRGGLRRAWTRGLSVEAKSAGTGMATAIFTILSPAKP